MITRRRFLATSTALLTAPLDADAQQPGKVWRIGYLAVETKIAAARALLTFREGLRQLGYVEGKTLTVEIWAAEGRPEDLPALAAQLVGAKPDVIVTHNAGHALIVQKLTRTLPIVVLAAGELVSNGVVATLAKPGGNVTGMHLRLPSEMTKRSRASGGAGRGVAVGETRPPPRSLPPKRAQMEPSRPDALRRRPRGRTTATPRATPPLARLARASDRIATAHSR